MLHERSKDMHACTIDDPYCLGDIRFVYVSFFVAGINRSCGSLSFFFFFVVCESRLDTAVVEGRHHRKTVDARLGAQDLG